jgi:hypothetical protein
MTIPGKTAQALIQQVFGPGSKFPAGALGEAVEIGQAVAEIRALLATWAKASDE